MLRFSSSASIFLKYFASLSLSEPTNNASSMDPNTKFDWTMEPWQEATKEWLKFSSFLENYGVFIFGTEAYNKPPLPPSTPAVSPFFPNRDENFVHVQVSRQWRCKEWNSGLYPFGRIAVDDLGRELFVKVVQKTSKEWRILEFLTSPALRADPANHTIPVVSILHHHDQEAVFLVQAQWGDDWLYPCPANMKDRYAIAYQLLEGLAFMHRHGIGHGDLHVGNVVWNHHDTARFSPNSPDYRAVQHDFDFRLAFIDFGASVQFPIDSSDHHIPCQSPLDLIAPPPPFCAPEHDSIETKPLDLFAADVYSLGQILIHEAENSNVESVLPSEYNALLSEMTALEPSRRPSAEEGLKRLKEIMATTIYQ